MNYIHTYRHTYYNTCIVLEFLDYHISLFPDFPIPGNMENLKTCDIEISRSVKIQEYGNPEILKPYMFVGGCVCM